MANVNDDLRDRLETLYSYVLGLSNRDEIDEILRRYFKKILNHA